MENMGINVDVIRQNTVVGSSFGIICLNQDQKVVLWNPATKSATQLPDSGLGTGLQVGFGFDLHGDWKVVVARVANNHIFGKVYRAEQESWRSISSPISLRSKTLSKGACTTYSYNWLIGNGQLYEGVLSFNMKDETFTMISLPAERSIQYLDLLPADMFETVALIDYQFDAKVCFIWLLQQSEKLSWTNHYTFTFKPSEVVLGFSSNGIILGVRRGQGSEITLMWGTPVLRGSHVFGMMGAALVASAEDVGMLLEGIFGAVVGSTASVKQIGDLFEMRLSLINVSSVLPILRENMGLLCSGNYHYNEADAEENVHQLLGDGSKELAHNDTDSSKYILSNENKDLLFLWLLHKICVLCLESGEKLSEIGSRLEYSSLTKEIAWEIQTLFRDSIQSEEKETIQKQYKKQGTLAGSVSNRHWITNDQQLLFSCICQVSMEVQVDNVLLPLPEDLVIKILLKLPVMSIIRFKCVSKSWCSIIKSQSFVDQHMNNSSNNRYVLVNGRIVIPGINNGKCKRVSTGIFSYDTLEAVTARTVSPALPLRQEDNLDHYFRDFWIMGCCNGLLLTYGHGRGRSRDKDFALWNPATGERKVLPTVSSRSQAADKNVCCVFETVGFGFDAQNNDYKVVMMHKLQPIYEMQILMCSPKPARIVVEVYSLRSDTWKEVATLVDATALTSIQDKDDNGGVFINGKYSWIANVKSIYGVKDEIISFDMTEEVIVKTPLPNPSISVSSFPDGCTFIRGREGGDYCKSCAQAHIIYNNYVLVYKDSLALVNCVRRLGATEIGEMTASGYGELHDTYDIWVLGEYGVQRSWKKAMSIRNPCGCIHQFMGFWKDNKAWLKPYEPEVGAFELFLGDLDGQQLVRTSLSIIGGDLKTFSYIQTLVPIQG
ncbi:hypothetical protein FNV43_RR11354 [Rhamnella rubrinervis]|uniref:F-box domain-containing protein n=1 Tax=Rhamnella rubrinervis TaxID=2594499 RepID=A0A8K0H647_9ROSA|nr:hypothetical protein FNV43_RR11354 [Rhamnella rubrinervis]